MRLTTISAVVAASLSTTVAAQTERDLDSHEHGAATLNIALDGNSVFVEMESPWNNLVGFEHAPSTDEQHAAIDDALAQLNQPAGLFAFEGANCEATLMEMVDSMAEGDDHDDHDDDHKDGDGHDDHDDHDDDHKDGDDHDDHDDDHKDADGHDDHDDHDDDHKDADGHDDHDDHDDDHKDDDHDDHDHDDHSAEGETHSELLVSYTFSCDDASSLTAIDVTFLELWSGFEDLDVQLIGPSGQALAELNPSAIRVDITQVQ